MARKETRVVTVNAINQVHIAREEGLFDAAATVMSALIYGGINEPVVLLKPEAQAAWREIKNLERTE